MNKCFIVLVFGILAVQAQAPVASNAVSAEMMNPSSGWRVTVNNAVSGATTRLQANLITVLSGLQNTTQTVVAPGVQNVTVALATLVRAVATNTFDLVGVVAYMPRLLLLDLPTQFVEVLRLIRRNEVRVIPTDVNSAIDNVLTMTRQAEESGITNRIFEPIAKFLPNILTGVHDFLQTIIGTTANVFGAGVYRYDQEVADAIHGRNVDERYRNYW